MIYQFISYFNKSYIYGVALIRKSSGSTSRGFLIAIVQNLFTMAMMMAIMLLLRGFGLKIRGPFLLFVYSGVAIFMFHNQLIMSFMKSERNLVPILAVPESVLVLGSVLEKLYMQTIATIVIFLAIYFFSSYDFVVDDAIACMWVFLLSIVYTISLGTLIAALVIKWPQTIKGLSMAYRRIGMITSGKMFPGNLAPASMLAMLQWNPLFHLIDQFRGALFPTYNPHNSNLLYPIQVSVLFFATAVFLSIWFRRQINVTR